ncbi:galactosyl transferase GMA12/MNN10 family-domain-containing protein [Stachybotrys elegans]|uniref:Galactosyl transferase GMA12/MNN10 family-domain-containing protein n=1 Tax=Stachybotrys elegans TaxID=80388 RepID=A0A8K0SCM1_9HYPO|nr:galactosyl transferase GMA12/MNN10 family-domain-containing protein [Stachybotrys elegans]
MSVRLLVRNQWLIVKTILILLLLIAFLQLLLHHETSGVSTIFRQPESVQASLHCYGETPCFEKLRTFPRSEIETLAGLCHDKASTNEPTTEVRIVGVTAQFNKPQSYYERALRTHLQHSVIHNSKVHILSTKIVDHLWNKPAFILQLLLSEMEKPEDERAQWLFWFDRDTIIIDTCRSLNTFLPPLGVARHESEERDDEQAAEDRSQYIHLVATKDWNGLNNGIFLLRVHHWSIDLFSAIMALRYYRPDEKLPFTEQSAMGILLEEPRFQQNVTWVPQWWFNAYPPGEKDFEGNATAPRNEYQARKGDFLVHFAGRGDRDKVMEPWLANAESIGGEWELEPQLRDIDAEIREFWDTESPDRRDLGS